jgi:hypothetical protein
MRRRGEEGGFHPSQIREEKGVTLLLPQAVNRGVGVGGLGMGKMFVIVVGNEEGMCAHDIPRRRAGT